MKRKIITAAVFILILIILVLLVIPQFKDYRVKSFNREAETTLRKAAIAQEHYFVNHKSYTDSLNDIKSDPYGLQVPENVKLKIHESADEDLTMTAYHESGSKGYILNGPIGNITKCSDYQYKKLIDGLDDIF